MASPMIRVPEALVDKVRALSELHRKGKTLEVIAGLDQLISSLISPDITQLSLLTSPDIRTLIADDINSAITQAVSDINADIKVISDRLENLERSIQTDPLASSRVPTTKVKVVRRSIESESDPLDESDLSNNEQLFTSQETAERLGYSSSRALLNQWYRHKEPIERNGWIATHTGEKRDKSDLWIIKKSND